MEVKNRWFFFVVFFIFIVRCFIYSYTVRNFSDKDGLSMNIGLSIVQDHMQYIWIGTQQGLNRFDGVSTGNGIFTTDDGLPGNFINMLCFENETLWVATRKGLARYDYKTGKFSFFDESNELPHENVKCLEYSNAHGLLIGTSRGLCQYKKGGKIVLVKLLMDYTPENPPEVHAIEVDEQSNIVYIGTPKNGLFKMNNGTNTAVHVKKTEGMTIQALLLDEEVLWIGTDDGLRGYRERDSQIITLKNGFTNRGINALHKNNDNFWIGTGDGLYYKKGNKIYKHPATRKMESYYILSFYTDHEGGLWIGTYGGVSYFIEKGITYYSKEDGLVQNNVYGIFEDEKERIWLATYGGLTVIDYRENNDVFIKTFNSDTHKNFSSNCLRTVTGNKNGTYWVGTYAGGLIKAEEIQPTRHKEEIKLNVISYKRPIQRKFPHNNVRVVFLDNRDNLWLGMQYGGLFWVKDEEAHPLSDFPTFEKKDNLFNNNVWFIFQDSKDRLWIGVDDGLTRIDLYGKEPTKHYNKDNGLHCKDTQAIMEDQENNGYWIGTFGNGLYFLEYDQHDEPKHYTKKVGNLPDDCIYGILKSKNKNELWLATNKGVCLWNKESGETKKTYTAENGLPTNENNSRSGHVDNKKRLWFSTTGGVVVIEPDKTDLLKNNVKSNVYIEQIIVKDKDDNEVIQRNLLLNKEELKLSHDQNNIFIKFTALSYQFPKAVKFKISLQSEENKSSWSDVKKRFVEYPNLPPGNYKFQVKAWNNDDEVCLNPAVYNFKITPPFTGTVWFSILLILSGSAFIYFFFQFYHHSRNEKKLARIVKQRTEEIEKIQAHLYQEEKMASLGRLVSGVAHELNNPAGFIKSNSENFFNVWKDIQPILDQYYKNNGSFTITNLPYPDAKGRIEKLISGLLKGSERIKKIIWELKNFSRKEDPNIRNDVDVNGVLQSTVDLTKNMINKATQRFFTQYEKDLPPIHGNSQQLERVFINVIENACQALPNNNCAILVTTTYDKKNEKIVVQIKDEGIGINEKDMKYIMEPFFTTKRSLGGTGLGLSISWKIVQDHEGTIEFESKLKEGTIVFIRFPIKQLIEAQKNK